MQLPADDSCSWIGEQLHICCTRQPLGHGREDCHGAATQTGTKDVYVETLEELVEALVEEPVGNSSVVSDGTPMRACILGLTCS